MEMDIWSVVVAAGQGTRFGAPKQLQPVLDRRMVDWSIDLLASFGPTVLVGPGGEVDAEGGVVEPEVFFRSESPLSMSSMSKVERFAAGGSSRSASVRSGLNCVADKASHVLIHDAARPALTRALVERVLDALARGADGAIPVVPVVDTLRTVDGDPVDRSNFVAVQTPQGFSLDLLRRAHEDEADATDDSALIAAVGGSVVHVLGDVENLKVTEAHDLPLVASILGARKE